MANVSENAPELENTSPESEAAKQYSLIGAEQTDDGTDAVRLCWSTGPGAAEISRQRQQVPDPPTTHTKERKIAVNKPEQPKCMYTVASNVVRAVNASSAYCEYGNVLVSAGVSPGT